jgi:hypothetical protein
MLKMKTNNFFYLVNDESLKSNLLIKKTFNKNQKS